MWSEQAVRHREAQGLVLNRRDLLCAAAATLLVGNKAEASDHKLAVIDWGLLETALAIGAVPAAATELIQYRKITAEPRVPDSVADLGLRGSPNYELLRSVEPDLILISGFYEYQRPVLERIAPVLSLAVYEAGTPPFALARSSTRLLGERIGRLSEAERYIRQTEEDLEQRSAELKPLSSRPAFVISLGDSRHFRAFGNDSMFGDVLGRLGIENAWTDDTNYSAAAPVGLEALARVPDASIMVIGPLPPEVHRALPDNALWQALPAVREGRVAYLDPINHFGGLASARRFARLLAEATAGDKAE